MAARRLGLRVTAALVSTVLCLCGLEAAFRVANLGDPGDESELKFSWRPHEPFVPAGDPLVFHQLRPDFQGEMVYLRAADGSVSRTVPYHLSALGLRRTGAEGPGGTTLALGDSMTFGQGVRDEEAWPAALGRRLGGTVWNAGTPGWNTSQEARWWEMHATELHPDAMVLLWFANDVEAPGQLVRAQPPTQIPLSTPAWARPGPERFSFVATWTRRTLLRQTLAREALAGWADYRDTLLERSTAPATRAAQSSAFLRIAATCRTVHARCMVALLPLIQAAEDRRSRALLDTAAEQARAAGLAVLDLAPVVGSVPLAERSVLASDPHPSAALHAALAEVIAGQLATSFASPGGD